MLMHEPCSMATKHACYARLTYSYSSKLCELSAFGWTWPCIFPLSAFGQRAFARIQRAVNEPRASNAAAYTIPPRQESFRTCFAYPHMERSQSPPYSADVGPQVPQLVASDLLRPDLAPLSLFFCPSWLLPAFLPPSSILSSMVRSPSILNHSPIRYYLLEGVL